MKKITVINMKAKIIFIGVSVFLYVSFSIPITQAQTPPSAIRINEIAWMGTDVSQYGEWIELYNSSSSEIDLKDWKLYKKKNGADAMIVSLTKKISSNSYYLIERTTPSTPDPIPGIEDDAGGWKESGLSNSGEFLILKDANGNTVDSVDGSNSWKINGSSKTIGDNTVPKKTAQYIDATWQTLLPTPKAENSDEADKKDENKNNNESSTGRSVRLNEVLPDPSAKGDSGEFIELYNFGTESTNISGWEILDALALKKKSDGESLTENDKLIFPNATIIDSGKYFTATDTDPWFSLTLNNTDETLSLFDKNGTLIDSLHFDKSKENISLNYTSTGWRGGTPTPGTANQLNNLPETKEKVPKKGYHGVAVDFNARGQDADSDSLKYTWDFGDGHKSYKEETTHTYEENGTYAVTLKTSDGKEDTLETFTLKIESFPHLKVRITSFVPNPSGSDTESEWIVLENREKKTVNLKDYSIATGWKKLSNHPINEDFLIKAKGEAKLTRTFSLFTLPNQKGKIELRAPDGKVLQDIKYKSEKSIAEDTVYQKKKGEKWKFVESVSKSIVPAPPAKIEESNGFVPEKENQEDVRPSAPEENSDEEPEKVSALAPVSSDPHSLKPEQLLAYGTRIRLADTIKLTPPDMEMTALITETAPSSLSLTEKLASEINASLNELFNSPQK